MPRADKVVPNGPAPRRRKTAKERSSGVHVTRKTSMPEEVEARAVETGHLVVMHSGARWNSGGGGQRPQQLAEALAEQAAVVHLCSGDRNIVQRPVRTPVIAATRYINDYVGRAWPEGIRKVFYTGYPDPVLSGLLEALPLDWFMVYDCIDAWADFTPNAWYSAAYERKAVRNAGLVTCTAQVLREHVAGLGVRRPPPVEFLPNSTALVGQEWWPDERDVDCVFVGWLENGWQSFDLFWRLCNNGHRLQVIGPRPRAGWPFEHENCEWLGQVANADLLPYLSRARVGIIPFRPGKLTEAVFPIKYCDYLAAGLPTVATHLPELDGWPFAQVAYSGAEFERMVEEALAREWPRKEIAREARAHTREARAQQLVQWLEREGAW